MLNVTQMLKIQENVDSNILVFYKHAMLSLLEFLFQGYHQYAQFRGSFISFIHASFVEQTTTNQQEKLPDNDMRFEAI